MLDGKIGRFYRPTKSADFCMTDDRFLLADFIGRGNRPTLSIVWRRVQTDSYGRLVETHFEYGGADKDRDVVKVDVGPGFHPVLYFTRPAQAGRLAEYTVRERSHVVQLRQ